MPGGDEFAPAPPLDDACARTSRSFTLSTNRMVQSSPASAAILRVCMNFAPTMSPDRFSWMPTKTLKGFVSGPAAKDHFCGSVICDSSSPRIAAEAARAARSCGSSSSSTLAPSRCSLSRCSLSRCSLSRCSLSAISLCSLSRCSLSWYSSDSSIARCIFSSLVSRTTAADSDSASASCSSANSSSSADMVEWSVFFSKNVFLFECFY